MIVIFLVYSPVNLGLAGNQPCRMEPTKKRQLYHREEAILGMKRQNTMESMKRKTHSIRIQFASPAGQGQVKNQPSTSKLT
jgi:hypothetical protein